MLIPLRHENMEGRRWPVVTFTLIALAAYWGMREGVAARGCERRRPIDIKLSI